ncbi:MAG: helix-turn-helix transcriptional regulator [Devosiaceae bacterium]|nr:helix-turn-helix transcriptional regulator [Devosiaceae bacterium]
MGKITLIKRQVKNNIRRLRFEHDEMTQKKLAELVGVTRQTIVAIENAKYAPSLELAFLIALAFNTPLQDVFSYEVSKNSDRTVK